jgi:hypothetical protein
LQSGYALGLSVGVSALAHCVNSSPRHLRDFSEIMFKDVTQPILSPAKSL